MTLAELPEQMKLVGETGATEIGGKPVRAGFLIADKRWETLTHVAKDVLAELTPTQLTAQTAQGKNVDHITRVTGYFSYQSRWNKGKQAELKDRHRVRMKEATIT